jgi:hypothetical protein
MTMIDALLATREIIQAARVDAATAVHVAYRRTTAAELDDAGTHPAVDYHAAYRRYHEATLAALTEQMDLNDDAIRAACARINAMRDAL